MIGGGTVTLGGTVNLGGTNVFNGGSVDFTGNYTCTNNTMAFNNGATASFDGTGMVSPNLLNLFGTLGGAQNVTVGSAMNWTGGAIPAPAGRSSRRERHSPSTIRPLSP